MQIRSPTANRVSRLMGQLNAKQEQLAHRIEAKLRAFEQLGLSSCPELEVMALRSEASSNFFVGKTTFARSPIWVKYLRPALMGSKIGFELYTESENKNSFGWNQKVRPSEIRNFVLSHDLDAGQAMLRSLELLEKRLAQAAAG